MKIIARIHTDFPEKFGLPRQSGLVEDLTGRIVFEPEYAVKEAFRGIEEYTHLWLIWEFSEHVGHPWSPTVRPPRLGGNTRVGVFATRSPFRPNPVGLSCVKLLRLEEDPKDGPVLLVSGADLMDGTPIYDIKPYLPYTDAHPEASGSFAAAHMDEQLQVKYDPKLLESLSAEQQRALIAVLEQDPRPHYQKDPNRLYHLRFAGYEVGFRIQESILTIEQIVKE